MKAFDRIVRRPHRFGTLGLLISTLVLGVFGAAPASANPANFDFESAAGSFSTTQAADHPNFETAFNFNGDPSQLEENIFAKPRPWANLKDLPVELPAGLVGNPADFPTCSAEQLITSAGSGDIKPGKCPGESKVGVVYFGGWGFLPSPPGWAAPLFNMPSPGGDVAARLGFVAAFYPTIIDIRLDPSRDYALTATVANAPTVAQVTGSKAVVWGVPADPSHDQERAYDFNNATAAFECTGLPPEEKVCPPTVASGLPQIPFMSNPTSCGPKDVSFNANTYQRPDTFVEATASLGSIDGCESVPFEPALSLQPTTRRAGAPSGVDFSLSIPQDGLTEPGGGLASAHLKDVVLTLPEGVTVNPSGADGLGACTTAQIGLVSTSPIRFNANEPQCPGSSKVGTGTIATPILSEELQGELYLADQRDNPFNTLVSGYLVVRGKGILVKQAGRFELDPSTGRIKAIFQGNPQVPFSELSLHFKGGSRGVITTPKACGTYETAYEFTPWSGNPPVTGVSEFTIDEGCGPKGFNPGFEAGSANPFAGAHTPFTMRLTREAGTPELSGLTLNPPQGLTGKLAGIPYCPEAALASISGAPGTGSAQIASPSCPQASYLGSVIAGAGSGDPFYVSTGKAYLAGPYKGAPLSVAIVTPAVAGAFDLGNVLVRTALYVDPKTAQLRAVSDPLPRILHGIPLELRDARVAIDRPQFVLNPTNCEQMAVGATILGTGGASALASNPFQMGACGDLGFKPRLALRLKGGTKRGDNPKLIAILSPREGDANISRAQVTLPRSAFLDQGHIKTVCTRVQFAADECPAGSIYGKASATTPLLDYPLSGNVYLRSSDNPLPDLVADLRGPAHQPIRIEAVGRTDSVRGALRNTFDVVPDAPVSKFRLELFGGKRGLVVNSTDICKRPYRARVAMDAHNGRRALMRPRLRNGGCGKGEAERSAAE